MRKVRWLVAAGLMISTIGCVETNGYPTTGYGGYSSYGGYPSSGYYGSNYGYYGQPTYYRPAPQVVSPRPYPRSSWGSRDSDGDGIPNRHDRDRNNDGIPDRQQRWNRPG